MSVSICGRYRALALWTQRVVDKISETSSTESRCNFKKSQNVKFLNVGSSPLVFNFPLSVLFSRLDCPVSVKPLASLIVVGYPRLHFDIFFNLFILIILSFKYEYLYT